MRTTAHLAPPHTRHEEEPRGHGVEAAALEGPHLVGLDAAVAAPGGSVARTAAKSAVPEHLRPPGGVFPRRARPPARRTVQLVWWWTHGLPPQLVNRGRRHAAHRGGFRRPSHVRATPPCRRPAPTGCGCASPRSGGDHLRHAHPASPGWRTSSSCRSRRGASGGTPRSRTGRRTRRRTARVSHRPAPQRARPSTSS